MLWRFLLMLALVAGQAQAAYEAREVKAAVLYHLTLYVDWPGDKPATLDLCVFTENEGMAEALARLGGKTVKGSRLVVWRMQPGSDTARCRIVYLGETAEAARLLRALETRPVLTVADEATAGGAVVNLGVENERVYFDVDLATARRAGLAVSARLLRLARRVQGL